MGDLPEEGHVGVPRALREHLQQCFFARGPMGTVAMVAGLMRLFGAILMDIGVLIETYLVEQQLFDEAVGMPVQADARKTPALPTHGSCAAAAGAPRSSDGGGAR